MKRVLAGLGLKEETKWGKPTFTLGGKNVVILQDFKEWFGLGFFQGALVEDPKGLLVQLGSVQAGRVMRFESAKEITASAKTIRSYVRAAIAVAKSGAKVEKKKTSDYAVPVELAARFERDARFKRAFDALTPGRQRSWLHHIGTAKQAATRETRIDKAIPAILAGRGFLERS